MRTLALILATSVALAAAYRFADLAADDGSDAECESEYRNCVGKGHKCVGDLVTFSCPAGNDSVDCCDWPLVCQKGKCVSSTTNGACDKDSDCAGYHFGTGVNQCQNGTCAELYNANDNCDNETQCYGGMPCDDDKCKGFPLNHTCLPPIVVNGKVFGYSCAWGLYCSPAANNTCQMVIPKGEACSDKEYGCEADSVCSNGTCTERWSVGKEGPCNPQYRLGVCKTGLYCSTMGVCTGAGDLVVSGCNSDDDCGKGTTGVCTCGPISGKKYCQWDDADDDCDSETKSAEKCWRSNKCAPVASKSDKSCAQVKCLTSTNKIFACRSQCSMYRTTVGHCLSNIITDNCPKVPTYAKILIAFGCLIAIIAIIAIIYVVVVHFQKKKALQTGGYQAVDQQQQPQ